MGRIRNVEFSEMIAASAIVAPADHAEEPTLLVVENFPSLSLAIDEVCVFLGIHVETVKSTLGVAETLHELQPIAVLAVTDEIDCAVYDLLMAVAGFDQELPVLLVTDDRASVRGAVHSAHKLWQLTGLIHLTRRLETNDLIDFLFRAGRKSGTGRMMPI